MRVIVRLALVAAVLGTAACSAILGIDLADLPLEDAGAVDAAPTGRDATTTDGSLPQDSAPPGDATTDSGAPDGDASEEEPSYGITLTVADGGQSALGSVDGMTTPFPIFPLPGLIAIRPGGPSFGASLAFGPQLGDYSFWLAIGAPGGDYEQGSKRGAVQLVKFLPSGGTLVFSVFFLEAMQVSDGDSFGQAVAFSPDGRYLAVGATTHLVNDLTATTGAVYVYVLTETGQWSYFASVNFPASSPTAFGTSLAFFTPDSRPPGTQTELLIGAPGDSATPGAAYLYRVVGTPLPDGGLDVDDGSLVAAGSVSYGPAGDRFGQSVAASKEGRALLIGAPSAGTGSDGGSRGAACLTNNANFSDAGSLRAYAAFGVFSADYGASVALSSDGLFSFIGEPGQASVDLRSVIVQMDGSSPVLFDNLTQLPFEAAGSGFGTSVALTVKNLYVGEPLAGSGSETIAALLTTGAGTPMVDTRPELRANAQLGAASAANDLGYGAASATYPDSPGSARVYIYH